MGVHWAEGWGSLGLDAIILPWVPFAHRGGVVYLRLTALPTILLLLSVVLLLKHTPLHPMQYVAGLGPYLHYLMLRSRDGRARSRGVCGCWVPAICPLVHTLVYRLGHRHIGSGSWDRFRDTVS